MDNIHTFVFYICPQWLCLNVITIIIIIQNMCIYLLPLFPRVPIILDAFTLLYARTKYKPLQYVLYRAIVFEREMFLHNYLYTIM